MSLLQDFYHAYDECLLWRYYNILNGSNVTHIIHLDTTRTIHTDVRKILLVLAFDRCMICSTAFYYLE